MQYLEQFLAYCSFSRYICWFGLIKLIACCLLIKPSKWKHYVNYCWAAVCRQNQYITVLKLPTSAGSSKKQESSRKTSISALLTIPKLLTVWITMNCGKFWKRWEYQTTWPASWEICMQVRKQLLELDMEQQTGSKWEKEYVKAVYCHPAYLTYMQSTSWETLGWKKHKLESRLPGKKSITSDM